VECEWSAVRAEPGADTGMSGMKRPVCSDATLPTVVADPNTMPR